MFLNILYSLNFKWRNDRDIYVSCFTQGSCFVKGIKTWVRVDGVKQRRLHKSSCINQQEVNGRARGTEKRMVKKVWMWITGLSVSVWKKKRKKASFSALLITTTSDVDSRLCNDCYHDKIFKAISLYLLPVCHWTLK